MSTGVIAPPRKPEIKTELPGPKAKQIVAADAKFVTPSYPRPDYKLVAERGSGVWVEDVDGNMFLDCNAGVAVCSTGHCHPEVVKAIQQQAAELIHMCGTDYYYRHMPQLMRERKVYLAQPPLYRIDAGKETAWALDEAHKEKILKTLNGRAKPEITRFKGLGEMMPKVLWETTLNPKTRRLLRVEIHDQIVTDRVINELMGKDPSARFKFIMERAETAEELDV